MLFSLIPILIIAFFVAGLIADLIPRKLIYRWLGREAGWKGFFIAPAVGALIQGGLHLFPLFAAVFQESMGVGTSIAMIATWGMINVGHLPYEFAFLGPRFVLLKLGVCLAIPSLTGFIAHVIFG